MDVVVIGAGIVGTSTALTLAERGVGVVVLERGSVAGEASGLNAGVIGAGGWGDQPTIDVALNMGSRDRYIDLAQQRGHDIGLDLTGTLTLIRTEEEWRWAEASVKADRQLGRRFELITTEELVGLEPFVDPTLLGAVLDPLAVRAEPVKATRAFATEAMSAGAVIKTSSAVTAIRPRTDGRWEVETEAKAQRDVFRADAVIFAAGPWCAELGAMVGVNVPIVAVRGQMWASEPQPLVLRHAIAAAEALRTWADEDTNNTTPPKLTHRFEHRITRHLYGRQRPNGEFVFGGDRVLTTDRTVDSDGISVNHDHVAELLPGVQNLPPARTWGGLMPFSLDGRPLIGPIPGHQGLFLAGGLASGGFGRGPMTGQLIADLVVGREPEFDLTSLAPVGRMV